MSRTGLTRTIADKIREAATQAEKQAVLEYYSYEKLLKRIILYTYSPLINFNMQDWKPKSAGKLHGMGMSKFMHIPEDIFQNKFTQEEAEFACNVALQNMNEDEVDIFVTMLKKDKDYFDLTNKTINAVWPDLKLTYPISCPSKNISLIDKYTFPLVAQKMSRGLRVNIIVRCNSVEFRDKNGNVLHNFDIYVEQFGNLAQNGSVVFDGHAVVVNDEMQIVATDDDVVLAAKPENVRFILWDTIRYDGFVEGKDNRIGYNWRFNGVEHMMFLAIDKNPTPCYRACESGVFNTREELDKAISSGDWIVKELSGTWHDGVTDWEVESRN